MSGRATVTTVMSSSSMKVPMHTVRRVHHLRSTPPPLGPRPGDRPASHRPADPADNGHGLDQPSSNRFRYTTSPVGGASSHPWSSADRAVEDDTACIDEGSERGNDSWPGRRKQD